MDLYKGYVPTKNKQCTMTFKGKSSNELMTLDQVKDLPEYAGILNDETILIDVDDSDQAEILMNIVEDLQLDCRVLQTSRGKHFLFRNKGVDQCYTHCKTAIGLTVDIKIGTKNSYEVLKTNGEERFEEWNTDNQSYQDLPVWLLPVRTDTDLLNMEDGDGRNSALFSYELVLQSAGLRNYDKAGRNQTGQTKGSFKEVHVDDDSLTATVGSNYENAIWEEFGTGIHAINGDGRKDVPWKYQDKKTGQWYSTSGKTGHRPFFTAFETLKPKIQKIIESKLGDL